MVSQRKDESREDYLARNRAYVAAYNAAHSEERRAYKAAYNAAHREERRASQRAYRAAHREERRAYKAAYDAAHREEIRAYFAAYRATEAGFHKRQNYWIRVGSLRRINQRADRALAELESQ